LCEESSLLITAASSTQSGTHVFFLLASFVFVFCLVFRFASRSGSCNMGRKTPRSAGCRKHVELCVRLLLFVFAGDLYQYLAHG
jgi:hypothetical protein